MNIIRFILFLFIFSTLVSCSWISSPFKNRDTEYLKARSIPPLRLPPGISSHSFHSSYPVSSTTYPRAVEDVSLMPPGLEK